MNTALHLGSTCSASSASSATAVLAAQSSGVWEATFDASALAIGSSYKLCSDLDGLSTFRPMGDTGLSIYVSPVAGAQKGRAMESGSCFVQGDGEKA